VQVIDYYHAGLNHYFITANLSEQALLDSGVTGGWTRTGASFEAEAPTSSSATTSPVCRFYGRPEVGLDSHFYSASQEECAAVTRKFSASWIYESGNVFRIQMPNQVTGACQAGAVPIYRVFNNRADANHRYTGDRALRDQMVAAGHLPEGYGPDNVAFCAKSSTSTATPSTSAPVPQAPPTGTPPTPGTTPAPPSLPPC
jgi:serine protease